MWGYAFRARQFAKGSLWLVPLAGAAFGVVLGVLAVDLEGDIATPKGLQYSAGTASVLLSSVVGSTAALTGFVVTVSVLVVQMAIGTFSARYMRLWYRDGLLKATLAVLVGTMTFSFTLLRHVTDTFVPNIGITAAGVFLFLGVLLFLLFLDRFLHRLRPVAVASLVAAAGRLALTSTPTAATTLTPVDHESVLEEYRPAIENELARLDTTVQAQFGGTVDLDLALRADRQGIGGPHSRARG